MNATLSTPSRQSIQKTIQKAAEKGGQTECVRVCVTYNDVGFSAEPAVFIIRNMTTQL